jgi:hypothetical protein
MRVECRWSASWTNSRGAKVVVQVLLPNGKVPTRMMSQRRFLSPLWGFRRLFV